MSNIKMIAVDMDGTFLSPQMTYDRDHFQRLYAKMKAEKILFVVASGNQYYQLKGFFEPFADELTFVTENGAFIKDKTELQVTCFPEGCRPLILDYLKSNPQLQAVVCTPHMAYILKGDPFAQMISNYYFRMKEVNDFNEVTEPLIKVNINFPREQTDHQVLTLNTLMPKELVAVSSGHGSLDLIQKGYNKAYGLKVLMDKYNIQPDELLAFGDGGNDIEMLRLAKYSYAMENATENVKAVAHYRAPSNQDNGVLRVIETYLL